MTTLSDLRDIFQLFDTLPTGIVLLDTEGCVLRLNELAAQRLAQDEGALLGQDMFREAFPELEQEGLGPRYRQEAEAGELALESEVRLDSPRGELRLWLGFRGFTFKGTMWGVLVVEDRGSLAKEEEKRKRAERLAAVGELAGGVAHEVNNPLASIKSFAQLLLREAVGSEQKHALEIIIQESTRIARVVENLLNFARQQGVSGREPVNLSAVAERVLELQSYALETAGIEVRKDLDGSLSPVMGEAGALQQVVLNLVVNAEQALAAKSGHRLLIVRTRESSEGVLLSVVDNGPGIPREMLPHMFDSLRGVNAPETEVGLGLGISATIVREHGGQIMAESEEGRGAAFFVRLPRAGGVAPAPPPPPPIVDVEPATASRTAPAPAPAPAASTASTSSAAPAAHAAAASRGAAAPAATAPAKPAGAERTLRVLVADDEATLRLAISLFLGRRGHRVTEAADAYEALRLAEEQEFDVALVDARMPGDGLRLLEKLEAMPALRGRTALMTGDLGRARTSQGIATGRPYLVKPFDMLEAVTLIEKLGR